MTRSRTRGFPDTGSRAMWVAGSALLVCGMAACGFGEGDPAPVPGEWTVEPVGSIAWRSGEDGGLVERVAVGPDGRIYLSREGEEIVRIYEPGGTEVASVGSGEEGAFRSVTDLGLLGDTLYVLDSRRSRVDVLTLEGESLGSWTWRPRTFPSTSGGLTVFAPAVPRTFVLRPDGSALVRPGTAGVGPRPPGSPGVVRWAERTPLLHLDRAGAVVDTVVWEEHHGFVLHLPHTGDTLRVPLPFEDHPLFAVMPDGSGVVVVERPVSRDTAAAYTAALVEPGRDTVWAHSFTYRPRAMDDQSVRRLVEGSLAPLMAEGADSAVVSEAVEALRAVNRVPASWSPVSRVVGAQDGMVWIGREEAGDSTTWEVLDSRGRLAGWVELPRGWEILAARADLVVVRDPDAPDPRALVVHRLSR